MPRWQLIVVFILAATVASAQSQQVPSRDVRPATKASGVIRGRVMTSDGFPARQAAVRLTALVGGESFPASADNEGRFSFDGVAPGRYRLQATTPGYLPFGYGQKSYPGSSEPITIGAGEELTGLELLLPRGGAIAGRLTNEYGEPVLRATVAAMKFGYTGSGQRTLQVSRPVDGGNPGVAGTFSGTRAITDDLGQFRLFGLEPGEYVVSAAPSEPAEVGVSTLAQTFYPGTSNPAEALPLRLGLAEESTIQLQLVPARLARISGLVLDSRGRPAPYGLPVMLRPQSSLAPGEMRAGNVQDGGEFSIEGVPPGDYALTVMPFPTGDSYPKQAGGPEFASHPVSIAGADIVDLRLTTRPLVTVMGRVSFDGVKPASFRSIDVGALPLNSADASLSIRFARSQQDGVRDDGTFEFSGIVGPVLLQVVANDAYMVKSITVDGADATDLPFDPTEHSGAVEARIVLTDKVTAVSGTVPRERLDATSTAVLIVADAVPPGAAPARYARFLRPDLEGRFDVRGLPPGRYTAAVVGAVDNTVIFDPQVQNRVRQVGRGFSVREGEHVSLELPATAGW